MYDTWNLYICIYLDDDDDDMCFFLSSFLIMYKNCDKYWICAYIKHIFQKSVT